MSNKNIMPQTENLFRSLLNKEVYATGQVKSFAAGSIIQDFNSYIRSIPIVIKGSIKVIRTDEEGREILLYYIDPAKAASCRCLLACITTQVR